MSNPAPTRDASPRDPSRRKWLTRGLIGIGGLGILGGLGFFGTRAVQATIAEADLSRIGKGIPAVVQIHDPHCLTCNALQKQTRKALRHFEEEELVYLVANTATVQGGAFAAQHNSQHVTLLFFDGQGRLRNRLQGLRKADELRLAFQRLASN